MRTTRQRAQGRSPWTLTTTLVLALLAAVLLAGPALGKSAKPGRPTAKAPAGTISSAQPTFKWSKAARAATYEVRVYEGSKQVLRKTGITKRSWQSSKALSQNVALSWKVRARNAGGNGLWSKSLKFTVLALKIGDHYGGGIVAYILQSGDPGYSANAQHGLIAATADQSTGIRWYNGTYVETEATATDLGTGLANTDRIIAVQGAPATSYAAGLARAYNGGGYSDWCLPSAEELRMLKVSEDAIGGFASADYWSSSEAAGATIARGYSAWYFTFGDVDQYGFTTKEHTDRVRAVRSF